MPGLIERAGLPPDTIENIIFLHDGATAHSAVVVREYLNIAFPGRWIGQGGPIPLPAHSPDLNCKS